MITNLFSIFDPRTYVLNFSYITFTLPLLILNQKHWKKQRSLNKLFNYTVVTLKKETDRRIGYIKKGNRWLVTSAILINFLLNFIALFPQVFSLTSHLIYTLPLSFILWIFTVMYNVLSITKNLIYHFLPQGTPMYLSSFIVLIEIIRTVIRPVTLCVRLTANLVAGHVLLTLLGNLFINLSVFSRLTLFILPVILSFLELFVAFIQAYVFITLVTLYLIDLK